MEGPESQQGGGERSQGQLALWITGLLGQVGCLTILLIGVALAAGLWLDNQFGSRPVFTLLLILATVPLTIYAMVRIVLRGMAQVQSDVMSQSLQEGEQEAESGRDT